MLALLDRPAIKFFQPDSLPPVIGLEGLPYAGKTLISKNLNNLGVERLGELAEFCKNGESFPAFSESTADARESFAWFVKAEVERFSKLHEVSHCSPIIADRTLVSCLAYSYARRKVFQIGDQRQEHEAIKDVVNQGQYFIPPLVYVRIPIQTYFERKDSTYDLRCEKLGKQAVENVTINEREREFFEAQMEYYDTIAHRLNQNSAESICLIDGTADSEFNNFKVENWANEQFYNYHSINLEDLLL